MSLGRMRYLTWLCIGGMLALGPTKADESLGLRLLGSWRLHGLISSFDGGKSLVNYGPHPLGMLTLERNGTFALVIVDPDLPKFSSGPVDKPTSFEMLANMKGSFSSLGSYSIDEKSRSIVFHIEASSLPNLNGTDQTQSINALSTDRLELTLGWPNEDAHADFLFQKNR